MALELIIVSFVALAKARHDDVVFVHCRLPEAVGGNQTMNRMEARACTIDSAQHNIGMTLEYSWNALEWFLFSFVVDCQPTPGN